MKRFQDRIALITGAGSGIGRAVATRLFDEGALVYGMDIAPPDDLPFECSLVDVSNEDAVDEVLRRIESEQGALDYLVNAAGVLTHGPRTPLKDQSLAQWEAVLRTNLTSVMLMIKHAHGLLLRSPRAAIVNLSSDQSFQGRATASPYGVSKAGINALTQIAALELAADGIRVNAVAPGVTKTAILNALGLDQTQQDEVFAQADQRLPFGAAEPGDVAALVLYLLSDEARRISGEIIRSDSGQALT